MFRVLIYAPPLLTIFRLTIFRVRVSSTPPIFQTSKDKLNGKIFLREGSLFKLLPCSCFQTLEDKLNTKSFLCEGS